MIVLDTNVLIEIEKKKSQIVEKLSSISISGGNMIGIASPTLSEYVYGLLKSRAKKESFEALDKYLLLNTSRESSYIFSTLKCDLEKNGTPIPLFDLLIASICIATGSILVTNDEHFRNIPGLSVKII